MSAKIIAIANQKGGVGKTQTAFCLGVGLARLGHKVLMCDMDPQGHLSMCLGATRADELEHTTTEAMFSIIDDTEKINPEDYIMTSEGVDFIPSDIRLSGLDIMLVNTEQRESILKFLLEDIATEYEFVVIDTSPSLGMLTINTLVAANSVIIPVQVENFSVKGMQLLLQSITRLQKRLNPGLTIDGILFTMVDHRTNISERVIKEVTQEYGNSFRIYSTQIPRTVSATKSSSESKSIFLYDPKGNLAEAYGNFAKEVAACG